MLILLNYQPILLMNKYLCVDFLCLHVNFFVIFCFMFCFVFLSYFAVHAWRHCRLEKWDLFRKKEGMGFAESYSKTQHKFWHSESMKVMNKFIEMCSFISICTYILVFLLIVWVMEWLFVHKMEPAGQFQIPAETVAFI